MVYDSITLFLQFDILWDALSSEEHLHLFASIKGLPPSSIKSVHHPNNIKYTSYSCVLQISDLNFWLSIPLRIYRLQRSYW